METIQVTIIAYLIVGAFCAGQLITNDSGWGIGTKTIASLLAVLLWLPFFFIFGLLKYILLPIYNFFELDFFIAFVVMKKKKEYDFSNDKMHLVRMNNFCLKLKEEADASVNPLKKLRVKIRSFCLKRINEFNSFEVRQDGDYRQYLRR